MSTAQQIVLVGRPNVGKSTLFNRLTESRAALVASIPGLTRDRQYGVAQFDERLFTIVDTGGLVPGTEGVGIAALMVAQVLSALDSADLVLFLVDLRAGISPDDHEIARLLRQRSRPTLVVANKTDGVSVDERIGDVYELGFGDPVPISASHGRGIVQLGEQILARVGGVDDAPDDDEDRADRGIVIGIVGRPNVGKSTLVNRILGEERVIVFDEPGTTRDSIYIPFEREGERFTLVDTAGVRRRGRVDEVIEKFSVIKALDAMRRSDVVLLVLDAREGVVEQDLRLLGFALEAGRSLILAINKWDGMSAAERDAVRHELDRRLDFAPWLRMAFISALHGSGVGELLQSARDLHLSARIRFSANELTTLLERILFAHPPPLVNGRRIKLRFAHTGGDSPPTVVIHGNQTESVPPAYRRYLENAFREALGLRGSALRIEFKASANPYAGRRNELSPRQRKRRERVIKHDRGMDRDKQRRR